MVINRLTLITLFSSNPLSHFTILLVYVDDVILPRDSLSEFATTKDVLHHAFKFKDLGTLKYFLGLEVAHYTKGISLCQRK